MATQNNAISIIRVKAKRKILKTAKNSKYRLCGDRDEMINHLSECSKLTYKEYKTRHDWVGKGIHLELYQENEIWPKKLVIHKQPRIHPGEQDGTAFPGILRYKPIS